MKNIVKIGLTVGQKVKKLRNVPKFLLYSVKSVNCDINCALFREVQGFIISTNRFSMTPV